MFDLREFIKKGLISAVGHMVAYQIILNAAGWLEKGVLTEEDLAEIVKHSKKSRKNTVAKKEDEYDKH